jgi:hypothetical protein
VTVLEVVNGDVLKEYLRNGPVPPHLDFIRTLHPRRHVSCAQLAVRGVPVR